MARRSVGIQDGDEIRPLSRAASSKPPVETTLPPLLVRLAGLPGATLEALASPRCAELVAANDRLAAELAAGRRSLVELIAAALSAHSPLERRFLLEVKRACFNARPLGGLAARPEWTLLAGLAPQLAAAMVDLEARCQEGEAQLEAAYEAELGRQRRGAAALAADRRFLRGVALGRPGLVEKMRAKAPALSAAAPAGAPARWELSWLRFVTRAAGKLSANSTLTVSGLGALHHGAEPVLRFAAGPARETSLVRLHRPEMEQLVALLAGLPAARERFLAAWNDTVENDPASPGRWRLVRDQRWTWELEAGAFRQEEKVRVAVRLDNPALAAARDLLAAGPLLFSRLAVGCAAAGEGDEAAAREALDQLIRLGLVLLLPPWPTCEPRLEERLLDFLRSLPPDPGLEPVVAAAAGLVEAERSFAAAERPELVARQIAERYGRLLATLLPAGAAAPAARPEVRVYEEVLTLAGGGEGATAGPEILSVAAGVAQEIVAVAGLVSRFASLFNPRHDFLGALAGWWRRNEPQRRSLPFLEIGRRCAGLWQDFLAFRQREAGRPEAAFDPYGEPAAAALAEQRRRRLEGYAALLAATPGHGRLDPELLEELLAEAPSRYAPLLGASAFAQPADPAGETWVFNNLHEGTGRFLSRLTPALEGRLERDFLAHLEARSGVRLAGGEEAELVEVPYPFGHLVRAHHPQTSRVFEWRGVVPGRSPERRLALAELRVEAELEAGAFRLVDGAGKRILPLHVSTLDEEMLPHLLRILLVFGPGEIRNVFPTSHSERLPGGAVVFRRLSCGRVVLRRSGWSCDLESLRAALANTDGVAAYRAVAAWRRELGLPAAVYYFENTHHGVAGALKPQFLDFTSPALSLLFAESVRRHPAPRLMLEEALPAPTDYPLDGAGQRRALELLFDSLMLSPPGGADGLV